MTGHLRRLPPSLFPARPRRTRRTLCGSASRASSGTTRRAASSSSSPPRRPTTSTRCVGRWEGGRKCRMGAMCKGHLVIPPSPSPPVPDQEGRPVHCQGLLADREHGIRAGEVCPPSAASYHATHLLLSSPPTSSSPSTSCSRWRRAARWPPSRSCSPRCGSSCARWASCVLRRAT